MNTHILYFTNRKIGMGQISFHFLLVSSSFFPFQNNSVNDCAIVRPSHSSTELQAEQSAVQCTGSDGNKSEIAVSSLDLKGNLCLGGTSSSPLSFCSSPYP